MFSQTFLFFSSVILVFQGNIKSFFCSRSFLGNIKSFFQSISMFSQTFHVYSVIPESRKLSHSPLVFQSFFVINHYILARLVRGARAGTMARLCERVCAGSGGSARGERGAGRAVGHVVVARAGTLGRV